MSRDPVHGGGEWDFGKCLWSPTRKPDGSRWAFWETTSLVKAGDNVIHLRGKGKEAAFVGFSKAFTDSFVSPESPPIPGQWSYSKEFYRAPLCDYAPLSTPMRLLDVFNYQDARLREYFLNNKKRGRTEKRRLFYVIQAGKLQCLNGAYLSEVDNDLLDILLQTPPVYPKEAIFVPVFASEVTTKEQVRELKVRVGQSDFAEQVRLNYNCSCCFPGCKIKDRRFLIAGHIARWVDELELRGQISNGICLCLLHDKAFELGLFTITLDYKVWVDKRKTHSGSWSEQNLFPYNGSSISVGKLLPSEKAIRAHWARHGVIALNNKLKSG